LTEIGVIAAQGPRHARELATLIEACDETIPFEVCEALAPLVVQRPHHQSKFYTACSRTRAGWSSNCRPARPNSTPKIDYTHLP
jgi:hypothetical protein